MELSTKPDVDKCLDRADAWWHRQIIDRPPVSIHVEARPRRRTPSHHADLRSRWLDVDYALDVAEANADSGAWIAETFPRFFPNLGPEICTSCYGAELTFSEYSSWSVPIAADIRQVLSMQPNLDSPYWRIIRQMTAASLERGRGKWITGLTDLHTNGDLLASLRDPQNLCLDLIDDLSGVVAAARHVTPHFEMFFNDLYAPIRAAGLPCSSWGTVVGRQKWYYANCDFICMISPEMFAATILPVIEHEIATLEHSIFHLDGPGALKHLDALLALPRLDAIQWIYGAGHGRAGDWLDVYRRIQSAGKGIEAICADAADARTLMRNLKPEGVWLAVGGKFSREEAATFLDEVARWAK